jgi:hypothetical protein
MYLLYIFIVEVIILIVISIILLFISDNNISKKINIEKFGNNIIFLNKTELFNILKENDDGYHEKFYKNDFYARKVNNIYEYINIMYTSSSNFNGSQKNKLIKCCEDADVFLNNLNYDWLKGEKLVNIDWKLGCIQGKYYENGLPHTRSDIIILPDTKVDKYSDERLTKLLIHEKIHLYQKLYPDDVDIYIKENNYKRIKKREEEDNIRANPDLDEWIYVDSKNKINKASYNDNPSSIEDIKYYPINNQNYEHPYERMAIEIENLYKK